MDMAVALAQAPDWVFGVLIGSIFLPVVAAVVRVKS